MEKVENFNRCIDPVSDHAATEVRDRNEASKAGGMPNTHWSVIAAARDPDSKIALVALEHLCQSYWYPLYAFLRSRGNSPSDAQDLTQGFLAELIAKHRLEQVDQAKGKFRCFLIAAIQHYANDAWDRLRAEKRGGRAKIVSLDEVQAEERFSREPSVELKPDELLDRRWAMTVLDNAIVRLEEEYRRTGKGPRFSALREFLSAKGTDESYAEVALKLRSTEPEATVSSVRCTVQRLRQRYGVLIREEVAETLAAPTKTTVDQEVSYLLSLVGR